MPGRPRTPTNVLQLRGAAKKNPGRFVERANEPDVVGSLGEPPAYLDDDHGVIWRELRDTLAPGTAGERDRVAFEQLVRVVWEQRQGLLVHPAAIAQLRALLASFGMTPADRSRVSVPKKGAGEANKFAGLRAPAR